MAIEIAPIKKPRLFGSWLLFQEQFKRALKPNYLPIKERMFFIEQLVLLLSAGTSIYDSLITIESQVQHKILKRVINDLIEKIAGGKSFSESLQAHTDVIPRAYVSLIEASEKGGFLHEVMLEILNLEKKREQLKSTMISSLSYPFFMVVFSIGVVIFILTFIFPKFAEMFAVLGDKLPLATEILMAISGVLQEYFRYIIVGLCLILWFAQKFFESDQGKSLANRFKLHCVGIKHIFMQIYLINIMRVLGLSLKNGVSMMEALYSCRNVVDNHLYQHFIDSVTEELKEGKGISPAFRNSRYVPVLVKQMMTMGEESSSLPLVAERIADYYEEKLSENLKLISKIAEPFMLLIMGLVIGGIVSALILPLFKLSQGVG